MLLLVRHLPGMLLPVFVLHILNTPCSSVQYKKLYIAWCCTDINWLAASVSLSVVSQQVQAWRFSYLSCYHCTADADCSWRVQLFSSRSRTSKSMRTGRRLALLPSKEHMLQPEGQLVKPSALETLSTL